MCFSKNLFFNLFVLLLFISISSCSKEINKNEFITGYAGTFTFHDIDTDSTVHIELQAFRFNEPSNIRTTINGFTLNSFRLNREGAFISDKLNIESEGFFSLNLKYGGRTSDYSSHLLPKLSYDKIELEEVENQSTLSWPNWEGVNYYSIDIEDSYYKRLVWDTLIVGQNELVLENDFLSSFSELKINVTAVKGPLPNHEYYNLKGDIPGQFLLISNSYIRWFRQQQVGEKSRESVSKSQNLIIDHILNRYQK